MGDLKGIMERDKERARERERVKALEGKQRQRVAT